MNLNYPAGTTKIKNLTKRYNYFLVIKYNNHDNLQIEYFVYRFKVPVSIKEGVDLLKKYFKETNLIECRALEDDEYATGFFKHPRYLNQGKESLIFKLREIPIYFQSEIRIIDLKKDLFRYGSKPIIKNETLPVLEHPIINDSKKII